MRHSSLDSCDRPYYVCIFVVKQPIVTAAGGINKPGARESDDRLGCADRSVTFPGDEAGGALVADKYEHIIVCDKAYLNIVT
jgi:hypothetical protein